MSQCLRDCRVTLKCFIFTLRVGKANKELYKFFFFYIIFEDGVATPTSSQESLRASDLGCRRCI